MARQQKARALALAPQLPAEFVAAPGRLGSRAEWDGVAADDALVVDDVVADAQLSESVFARSDLAGRRCTGWQVRDVVFDGCDLSGSVLDGAVLDRVVFTGCRLTGTMLTGARLRDVTLENCHARLLNLRATQARNLFARGTVFAEAEFGGATLTDSALLDCDLRAAVLTDLHVHGLSVHGSRLDDVIGATSLAGASIDADQRLLLGVLLVHELGIRETDRPATG